MLIFMPDDLRSKPPKYFNGLVFIDYDTYFTGKNWLGAYLSWLTVRTLEYDNGKSL